MLELLLDELPGNALVNVAGDTFNTAVYLRRCLGKPHSVDYLTALGADGLSDKMITAIQHHGLGIGGIRRLQDKLPGIYSISLDKTGERYFSYWRSDSAARGFFESEAGHVFERLAGFDCIYATGISLAILPDSTRLALLEWLKGYRLGGGVFAFDSNYRPSLWESRDIAAMRIDQFWQSCDIALPSLDDEMALFGEDETAVIQRFKGYHHTCAVVKRGARGPLVVSDEVVVPEPIAISKVVDTTAAGDSFCGAFLATYLTGHNLAQAVTAAHLLASQVVQHQGAIIPDVKNSPNLRIHLC